MRIYQMTATFGKLQNETLTLQPGLNILHAPNEWGKSTWCAFLAAMLYGLDTRAKTTKTVLADKERYAPWSGAPMAGRIDLCWQGRDITIERATRRRVPLGEFKAYETQSGLPVPELTAANCGEMLLGVEQSVFRRAGFIRFSDLPVTQDETLRRRLNALVTTGDENGDGEQLAQQLRDLKNRCRYNRSGLLPQAEELRRGLEGKLRELDALESTCASLTQQIEGQKTQLAQLEQHRAVLAYENYLRDARRLIQAERDYEAKEAACARLEEALSNAPTRQQAQEKLAQLRGLTLRRGQLRQEEAALPPQPDAPQAPGVFAVEDPEQMLRRDTEQYEALRGKKPGLWWIGTGLGLAAGIAFAVLRLWLAMGLGLAAGGLCAVLALAFSRRKKDGLAALEGKYGSADPAHWQGRWQSIRTAREAYQNARRIYEEKHAAYLERQEALDAEEAALCGGNSVEAQQAHWQSISSRWDDFDVCCREARQSRLHCDNLRAVIRPVEPAREDIVLPLDDPQTQARLLQCRETCQRLESRLWQSQGARDALGRREELEKQLDTCIARITALEDTYAALTIAQNTLEAAKQELQRRFAPRIARRAQELMGCLTDGRYQRLSLAEDLSIQSGAGEEETLHGVLWRSDGTMDQLYLALRLAVAEEVTPGAPLILDDALVRFDDDRLAAALRVLRRQAENRQVIVFTCQQRENRLLAGEKTE